MTTSGISDEYMECELARSKTYSFVMLLPGPKFDEATRELIWEHGRRNFQLRQEGVMNIVGPLRDDGEIQGICIFDREPDEAVRIMDGDPAVKAGVFGYEVHPFRGFPGDALA